MDETSITTTLKLGMSRITVGARRAVEASEEFEVVGAAVTGMSQASHRQCL